MEKILALWRDLDRKYTFFGGFVENLLESVRMRVKNTIFMTGYL
jgi:Flp pilus assembly CpaE family ATPase